MGFSETKVDETVSLLKASQEAGKGRDKRRAPRREIRAITSVMVTKEVKAELRDLSARGASLSMKERLEKGTQFSLQLPSKPGSVRRPVVCVVVHCRPQSDGTYLIGAEFVATSEERHQSDAQDAEQTDRIRQSILG
jgi:hypothetical protein